MLYKDYVVAHKTAVYVLLGAITARDMGVRTLSSILRQQNDDRLVFPILMCLHQHFELLLKLILSWIRATFEDETTHNLPELWASIERYRPDLVWGPSGTSESVSCLLDEFHRVTVDGFGGRYPFNVRKGATYLPDVENIDLLNLLCRTENLSHYFNEILRTMEQEAGM